MKIIVDSKSLADAVQWSTKSFDTRDDKAFLALHVTNEAVGSLSHANPTSYLKSGITVLEVDLDGQDELTIALQGQFMQRLASSLDPSGPSELIYENKTLKLKNKLGNFTIPTFAATIPSPPQLTKLGEVENVAYFDTLQRLAKICDPAGAVLMPVLGTVDLRFNADDKKVSLMATDRFTLGEVVIDFSPADSGEQLLKDKPVMLLPYEAATLVSPSKGSVNNTEIVFEESSNKFGYIFDDGRVSVFSLKEADPIVYKSIKDRAVVDVDNRVSLSTKDLQKAIATISTLAWDEITINMELADGKLIITDDTKSNRLEVDLEDSSFEGEHQVKFIRSVILKAFSPVATNKMNLLWNNAKRPFILEPVLDDGSVADNLFVLASPRS